jgi:hypothetical protein
MASVAMPPSSFSDIYKLQDIVLTALTSTDTEFYLTGGTAASRGYLHHRFSDDLDFFVNDDKRFTLWADRFRQALLLLPNAQCSVHVNEARFVRLLLHHLNIPLKIELVNDVPARVGTPSLHRQLGRLDTPENILANKISAAVDRNEPKDLADIWGFCTKLKLNLRDAITNAQSKAAGIFPADVARVLCSVEQSDWEVVNWIERPPLETFRSDLISLGEDLLRLR